MLNENYSYDSQSENNREAVIEQRMRYCVSEQDTWGFDGYLLVVLENGLRTLAKNAHGWPQSETYPEFEDWLNALNNAADDARWCEETFNELNMQVFKKYNQERLEEYGDDIEGFLNDKRQTEEEYKAERAERTRLHEERERRLAELLDFVHANFWSLWD